MLGAEGQVKKADQILCKVISRVFFTCFSHNFCVKRVKAPWSSYVSTLPGSKFS